MVKRRIQQCHSLQSFPLISPILVESTPSGKRKRYEELGEKQASRAQRFSRFQRFFCPASTQTQGLPKGSAEKRLKEAYSGTIESPRAGPVAWALGGAACSESRCRLSNLILPRSWRAAREVGNPLLCSESLSAFAEEYWPGAEKPFLMKVSSASIHSRKVFWWADILQRRCFTGRVPASSKYNTLTGLAAV